LVVSTNVTLFINCNLDGLSRTFVHHVNAYSSFGYFKSNLLIIPSTEHPIKQVGFEGSNWSDVIYPLKLSLNYALCFIFLISQNTSLDVWAAHKICSLKSSTLNYDPGSKINKILLKNLWISLPEFLSHNLTVKSLLPVIRISFFSLIQFILFSWRFYWNFVNDDLPISKIEILQFESGIKTSF
jgi:hypothetical protein